MTDEGGAGAGWWLWARAGFSHGLPRAQQAPVSFKGNQQPATDRRWGDPNPGTAAKKPLSFPCFLVDKAVDTSYGFVRVCAFVLSDAHCPSCTCSGLSYLDGVICFRYWKPLPEAERAQGRPGASAERAGGLGM